MAPISLRDNKIQELADIFVEKLTGFKKSSRNFNLSVQFAVSNFRYHRFLDVNSLKVSQAIKGVTHKFQVHSQFEKATAFEELCQKFLDLPLDDSNQDVKTDAHYSLILVLLQLSDSPTHAEYQPKEEPTEENDEDSFDWKAYLLDDAEEECLGLPHDESSLIWSDEEDDDEIDDGAASDSGVGQESRSPGSQEITLQESPVQHVTTPAERGRVWLLEQITSQYWDDYPVNVSSQDSSNYGHCTLATSWEDFQQSQNPFGHCHARMLTETFGHCHARMLTETQLVRETLWMLSGVHSSFVYSIHGNAVTVSNDFQVSHLSPESLSNALCTFAAIGEKSLRLQKFVSSVLAGDTGKQTLSASSDQTQTAQAFATALSCYFTDYKAHLTSLQKDIIDQKCPVTLIVLLDALKDKHEEIQALYSVYNEGVVASNNFSTSKRTSQLLDVFYKTICSCDHLGTSARAKVSLLLGVFLDTLRPSLDFIDSWVTLGELRDPMSEFFIHKNSSFTVENNAFWESGLTLRHDTPDSSSPDRCSAVPSFLLDLIKQIMLAGKSVNLIQGLGKMAEMFVNRNEVGSLYDEFMESFIETVSRKGSLTVNNKRGETANQSAVRGEGANRTAARDEAANQSAARGEAANRSETRGDLLGLVPSRDVVTITRDIGDPMLRANLLASSAIRSSETLQTNNYNQQMRKRLNSGILACMVPVDLLFRTSLAPLIQRKYTEACGALIRLLKAEYHLMDHLAAMRNFFLLEAGDTMHYFYADIFRKIRRRQPWQDISYLNSLLQEALHDKFPQSTERLAVSLAPNASGFKGAAINALQGMALNYKVPWPVSVVIDESCQKKYNQVLLFLLTLKRAKWSLDELRFTDLTGETRRKFSDSSDDEDDDEALQTGGGPIDQALLHQMFILRFRLLHFVNNLHNYIMTRILHTTGLEFQVDIAKAKDLDDVIVVHTSYVTKVYDRCLLSKKIGFVKEAITKVLNVALTFQSMWEVGIQHISSDGLMKVATEFSKCNHFVVTFLDNLVKRGAFPHLESLAYSLSMEVPSARPDIKAR